MSMKKSTVTKLKSNYMQKYEADMERKHHRKKRLFRRLILFAVIMLLAVGTMAAYHFNQRTVQSEKQDEFKQLENKLVSLKKEETNLQEEVKLLNNDEYVLEIARTNYFFSKEGELIFKIPNEGSSY